LEGRYHRNEKAMRQNTTAKSDYDLESN